MSARSADPARNAAVNLFHRTLRLLRPHRTEVIVGVVCVALAAPLSLWMPQLLGHTIDQVANLVRDGGGGGGDAPPGSALLRLSLLILAVGTAEVSLKLIGRRKIIHASRRFEESLKNQLMAHLTRLPLSWFDRAQTGDLISRFTQDVELLRFIVGPTVLHGTAALLIVPGGIYIMASLSWQVFAVGLTAFALLAGSMLLVMPRMHEHSVAVQESIARISQRCAEDFGGIRVLMNFGRAPAEVQAMASMSDDYLQHNVELGRSRAVLNLLIHGSRELVMLGVLVLGAMETVAGRLTVGELFQFLMLVGVMVWPLIALSWLLGTVQRARAAALRVEEIFAVQPEQLRGTEIELRGHLTVRHLTFTYPGAAEPALRDVSFELRPGQKLGLIGPIGAGKSTLLDLILRLYDPPPGTILVDGHDVLELHPAALRRAFAVAPQDPFLFSDTIRGNVVFGSAAAAGTDEDEVARAVHTSAVDQDLESYPRGLESVVGERGLTLSGGQKQRVSLARALAANRSALLLDDTLSAVDHHTEAEILARLRSQRTGATGTDARSAGTTVVATHRVSAVADADLIVVLDRGRVIEQGTPAELIAGGRAGRPGYFAQAHERQRERSALEGAD